MEQMKYVRVKDYNSIIIFPQIIQHKEFKEFEPVSAGFCYVSSEKITCFGESISLDLKSNEVDDTFEATKQYCGIEQALKLI